MLFTRHYYEKVYLKVLADWRLLFDGFIIGEEIKVVKILKSIVDDPNNTDKKLEDDENFSKTEGTGEDSDYYIYSRI